MIADLVSSADPKCLLMSRKNCHAKNVSSIVIEDDGALTRMFLAFPGHELATNTPDGKLVVGIHNHMYPLTLTLLHGEVTNHHFRPGPSGEMYEHYWYFSGINSGPIVKRRGCERIRWTENVPLSESPLDLPAHKLHTISCSEKAAWLVQEGPRCRDYTDLYTNEPIDTTGLYEKFDSVEEVLEHVNEFIAC